MFCYIALEEKLFRVQIYETKSRERSTCTGNRALLPSDVIDLQCCPLRDFGGKHFYCEMSCDLEVTNERGPRCWETAI